MDGAEERAVFQKRQAGQAMVEYLILLSFMLFFAHFIFLHGEYGLKGLLNRTMLRLGVHLEQNLKSGTGSGNAGERSREPYAGASTWSN